MLPLLHLSTTNELGKSDLDHFTQNLPSILSDWKDELCRLCTQSSEEEKVLGVLSICALVLFVWFIWVLKKNYKKGFINARLLPLFICIFIYGVIVYDIGMYTEENYSLITNLPMAILYGFKIFLFDSDVSEIHEPFHKSWLYSGNFALVHALAACFTAVFLIKHFGFNLIARIKLRLARHHWSKIKDTYIFWGLNEQSCQLIESVCKKYEDKAEKEGKQVKEFRIIVVRTNNEDDDSRDQDEKLGFNRVFGFLSMKVSEIDVIQQYYCLTTGTYANMSSVKAPSKPGVFDLLGNGLRLRSLKKLLGSKRARGKLHIFLLSNDSEENLEALSLLKNDETINKFAKDSDREGNKREVFFYCHTRYNSIHRVIEDQNSTDNIQVRVVDSSHISVEMLKTKPTLLPVNFVDVEADSSVSSKFNALVVGFSEVGQDMVRFLYEFGAFVKHGSTDSKVERSEFHIDIVDKDLDSIAGPFFSNFTPCDEKKRVSRHQMDCKSLAFFEELKNRINELNYIVICTENDELNMATAVRVFKMALRYRDNMDKLCILARIHNDNNGLFQKIADHYNKLLAAQPDDHKELKQSVLRRDKEAPELPISIFGLDISTYTYDNIIDDTVLKEAKKYYEEYAVNSGEKPRPKEGEDNLWVQRYREMMLIGTPCYPTYGGLMKLRRSQMQDIANSMHKLTKSLLAEKALKKIGKEALDKLGIKIPYSWNNLTRYGATMEYLDENGKPVSPEIAKILLVLAQTEHLRWNASHEMLGYRSIGAPGEKDEVRMCHGSIVAWEKLKEGDKPYDCNVVDVSLKINIRNKSDSEHAVIENDGRACQ